MNRHRSAVRPVERLLALSVVLTLAAPSPAFALRAQAAHEVKEQSGLEEALRSGNPDDAIHAVSNRVTQAAQTLGVVPAPPHRSAAAGLEGAAGSSEFEEEAVTGGEPDRILAGFL